MTGEIKFFRWDTKLFHYSIVKVEHKNGVSTSKILFRIPKFVPDAKEITKHITHSLASGTMGIPIIGIKKTQQ